ncbi:DUF6493 family protein [Streptomyces sp. NPDC050400]|uniref:DUF7824 domain-containing protein n=1 Tax=Streptomyces sp. NPDC050400 TaxID=3365610 RepID=UPI003793BE6F
MSQDVLMRAVRKGDLDRTAELLDAMTDSERRGCLPELKALRKELRAEPWGAGARVAYPALQMAGGACHTGAAAAATWLGAADWRWQRRAAPQAVLHMLGDRETEWLADVAHRLAALPQSRGVSYDLVAGLVALSGCPVPTTEAYVVGWVDHVNSGRRHDRPLADRLRAEPHVGELTAALFETDDIGSRLDWFDAGGPHSWPRGLATLAEEGVVERKALVDACVARLLRGGRQSDTRLFLLVLDALALTREEEGERIADWVALCADGAAPIAAHAQQVLGALAADGGVTARTLADVSAAVLFRPEKKLVRAQLVLLGKVLKGGAAQGDPSVADELLPAVGEAFGHPDTEVQERALKLVARHIAATGTATRGRLALSADQLSAGLRPRAQEVLGVALSAEGPYEEVLPSAPEPFRLAPAPDSAQEVAEEVGAILASGGDMAAFERTLDGLMRHAYHDRAALKEALLPAVSRRWWFDADRQGYTQRYFRDAPFGLEVVAATAVDAVDTRTLHAAKEHPSDSGRHRFSDLALRRSYDARLWEAAYRIRTEPAPCLLATPTWSSGFVDPDDLVARLGVYAAAGARAGQADLAQALLRVDRGSPQAPGAAVAAAALGTAEGDRVAAWLTAPEPAEPGSVERALDVQLLVDMEAVPELRDGLPEPFSKLGEPLTRGMDRGYWYAESGTPQEHSHWLAALPGRRELVAARLLREVAHCAVLEVRGAAAYLPLLAEAEGPAGSAVRLTVAYGLAARHPEDRLAGVDALLILAGRGQLDAELLGAATARAWALGGLKTTRIADSLGTAASTGAYATVLAVLRGLLPVLLASKESPAGLRGLGDLLGIAADCAERTGAQGRISGVAEVAARKGSSRLVTQARRLHTALG